MRTWRAFGAPARRDVLTAALVAALAEISAAGLLGVAGWFLASCAVITLRGNTGWSWLYPSGVVRSLALARTALRYLERFVSHRATLRGAASLRAETIRTAGSVPVRRLRAQGDGSLLTAARRDVDVVASAPVQVISPLAGIMATTAACATLLWTASPVLGAVVIAGASASFLAALLSARRRRGVGEVVIATRSAARTSLLAARAVADELRWLPEAGRLSASVETLFAHADQAERRLRAQLGQSQAVLRIIAAAMLLAALGAAALAGTGQSVADSVGAVLLVMAVCDLLEQLPHVFDDAHDAHRGVRALEEVAPAAPAGASLARFTGPVAGALEVHDLALGPRPDSARWSACLDQPGTTLLAGPNGSGKSTALATLAGRVAPARAASITLGGIPLADLPGSVIAAAVTLVETDDWLADDTIAYNLRLAAPAAPDADLHAVLAACALGELALDVRAGPGGSALSAGQRRRLAVARALLRRPAVLLLDEPTAGSDAGSAFRLMHGVRAYLPRAAIVVATPQHPSLFPLDADRVVHLGGRDLVQPLGEVRPVS